MKKIILSILLGLVSIYAECTPVSHYERTIDVNQSIIYHHTQSDFHIKVKRLIDTDNYYNKGKANTYDDPYIQSILDTQKVLYHANKEQYKNIQIVFSSRKQQIKYLKEQGIQLFYEHNLSVELIELDKKKLQHPLSLTVYPFFVIGSRYIQGTVNKKSLHELLKEDTSYYLESSQITLINLYKRLNEKYAQTQKDIVLNYNKSIELFEVRKVKETEVYSYISKDGRYILVK